jgi:ketosteroid isomerase-like protein
MRTRRAATDILTAVVLVFTAAMAACTQQRATQAEAVNDEEAVRDALEASRVAWNDGNFEDCMSVYWDSPQLTLRSGGETIRGYAEVVEHQRNQALGGHMGQLDYDDVVVDLLSKDAALVRGGWRWTSGDQEQHGSFTALMRKFPDGWKIVHEHSS